MVVFFKAKRKVAIGRVKYLLNIVEAHGCSNHLFSVNKLNFKSII
jgi:hypothetical protein